ncbi:hypothetical protein EWB00_002620 [Schistosoma japonicum]|uniref:Uncharacterized protein n=1 Tax=Schistosoma japonicum TaxID=6182 RepID=A0A4Z2DBP9_SCHJA|nr:hypothetical protein EWB00_002620 [Schistosoma japonicum]TNN13839.1 hypothetical protein EWB00_002620 [Schistosoma japonicum]
MPCGCDCVASLPILQYFTSQGLRASLEVTGLKSACFELQVVLVTVVLPTRSINKCTRCYNAINLPSVRFTFLTVVYDVAYIC